MEKHSSYLSPKAKVGLSCINKKGIFAKKAIKKNEIIAIFGGDVITRQEYKSLAKKNKQYGKYGLKIADDFYMASHSIKESREPSEFFNHSCQPNAGMRGQIILTAMKKIKPGQEITFDYAMTDDDREDCFKCCCGARNCRQIITNNDWKLLKLQKKYKTYFSDYIQEKINKNLTRF